MKHQEMKMKLLKKKIVTLLCSTFLEFQQMCELWATLLGKVRVINGEKREVWDVLLEWNGMGEEIKGGV